MMTKRVSVMIVEDSPVAQELIARALRSDPRLRVSCAVETAERALGVLRFADVDVISMDIRLPGIDGIEATRRIMEERPTPIVILAADARNDTVKTSMEALRAGALAVVKKPAVESAESYGAMARHLCDQFVNLSQVRVVRQRFNGARGDSGEGRMAAASPLARRARTGPPAGRAAPIEALAIVASTGGPAAVATVLQGLGRGLPVPVLVVQHMASEFIEGYASWLDAICAMDVALARDLEAPVPGRAYVAPADRHMIHRAGRLRLIDPQAAGGPVPSADVLLGSLADSLGDRAIGVILTGMGADGAYGLLEMRRHGARTLGQDRHSSAVYGMPAAARGLGAVEAELPIGAMADRIRLLLQAAGSAGAR